jgi:glycosyltransferase involved in cell wall biosynthesis
MFHQPPDGYLSHQVYFGKIMNIIIANGQEFNPQLGGIEKDSAILAEQFVSLGHNVYFIAGKRSPFSNKFTPVVEQSFLPDQSHFLSDVNIRFFSEYLQIRNADVIMNQAGDIHEFSLLCSESAKNSNTKLYSVVHFDPLATINELSDFSNSILGVNGFFRRILKRLIYPYRYYVIKKEVRAQYRKLYKISTRVVLLSKYFIPSFRKLIRFSVKNKITAILNPSPQLYKSENINRKRQLLYVGRIKYFQKRTDRIIDIWEKIYREFPDWELVIVGEGPLLIDLKKYVVDNNIERVSFKGLCDPEIYYRESEILCMTSTSEGLGMVLVEAVKLGCIPVAFDSYPAINEIIRDNVNGILVNKFNIKKYIKALRMLMLNSEIRNRLRKSTLVIDGKFDPDNITQQWINLFEKNYENKILKLFRIADSG